MLGYPGETSKALHADHHNVCKYDSPKDPNYITVKNALSSIVGKIITPGRPKKPALSNRKESYDLKTLLAITELPDIDYIFFRDRWMRGTNEWLLDNEVYLNWVHAHNSAPSLLWLNGGAATGKSVLSSFIINSLVEQGLPCQYFFIRFGDSKKRSLSLLLRSIAYQIARNSPQFLDRLLQIADEAMDFGNADPRTIWEHIFKSILFGIEGSQPLYWIIDGLDEADDPRALVRLISEVSVSSMPIQVALVGRKNTEIADVFQKLGFSDFGGSISIEGHLEDLRCYIRQELSMSGTTEFKESVVERIVRGAQNNFLVGRKRSREPLVDQH